MILEKFRPATLAALMLPLIAALPLSAHGHVKWFSEYDVKTSPLALSELATSTLFLTLFAASLIAVLIVIAIDRRLTMPSGIARLEYAGERYASRFVRAATAVFFVSLQLAGLDVLLTPELASASALVPVLHYAIAALVLFEATAWLGGVLIVVLYAMGASQYGMFHMLDYVIFIGIAAFLVLVSLFRGQHVERALAILRLSTAFSLLWGAIEKFAYPDGFHQLFDAYPYLTFGLDRTFFLWSAGFVEFVCAYLLVAGRLSAKGSCVVLLFFFGIAVIPFGMVDAIGHCMFAASLIALLCTPNRTGATLRTFRSIGRFVGSMVVMFGTYYTLQTALV
ncbi:hypothetical protein [Burkholderia territorii]|uniref:Uncharacterized protein n=1 Tax=Burkholderia territorii TaxID=1503055 RepID=A0A6L3NBX3_9BURK|nr:hypothetical protein [Burkholderia territorii]KAB0654026.1 hypothetical protein F7R13_26315 [Burkholderia territorii]MBM2774536.1 hypothetical protein [Burkholderia territorii]VWB81636.1 hypothetical protein BTE28158_03873 [Burkholderia territorii]